MCEVDITNETEVSEASYLGPLLSDSPYLYHQQSISYLPTILSAHFTLNIEKILKTQAQLHML